MKAEEISYNEFQRKISNKEGIVVLMLHLHT